MRIKKSGAVNKTASVKNKENKPKVGHVYSVNDAKTRGHKSIITSANKRETKSGNFQHLPLTHAPTTRKMRNIKLYKNPDPYDDSNKPSHILPKTQMSNKDYLGKKHDKVKVKDSIDKAIIRNLKKKAKKK